MPLLRRGLAATLEEAGFAVGELSTIGDLPRVITAPAAIVVGVHEAPDLALRLDEAHPLIPRIVALWRPAPALYRQVLAAGIGAVFAVHDPPEDVVKVIDAALAGWTLLPGAVARALADGTAAHDGVPELDAQDKEWLDALASGLTVEELAHRADLSEREAYRRLKKIYERLSASSRTQALVQAARFGLID